MSCHKVILQLAENISEAHSKRRVSLLQQGSTKKGDPLMTSQFIFSYTAGDRCSYVTLSEINFEKNMTSIGPISR